MPAATDQQMQTFADQRIRPFAELFRALHGRAVDDAAAIGDEFTRAANGPLWADARTDGPPHLLASGPGASPDDLTNYNALVVALNTILAGTNTAQDAANAATVRANYAVLMRACVRPVGL